MSDWLDIAQLWDAAAGIEPCLFFSIASVSGSTYRRTGAHMLVTASGKRAGTVSAGCLEQDIFQQLPELFSKTANGEAQILSYNNRVDDPFALNRGCAGQVSIIVQQLVPGMPNLIDSYMQAQKTRCRVRWSSGVRLDDGSIFEETVEPTLRVVIFGAHPDAVAVARLAREAGYEAILVDWRASLLESAMVGDSGAQRASLFPGVTLRQERAEILNDYVGDERTAFVIMSHHYDEDKQALQILSTSVNAYVGVMGPRRRTTQMLGELGLSQSQMPARFRFPIGLDIGAETPGQIAISIIAEVMAEFARTEGRSLSAKNGPIHGGKIGIAILAAGAGSRFGGAKQIAQWQGMTLVSRAVNEALMLDNSLVAVVAGAHANAVQSELTGSNVTVLINGLWQSGIASSVRTAVDWARETGLAGLLILCCDQPLVTSNHMRSLVEKGIATGSMAASAYDGTLGVPAYFPHQLFDELLALDGDRGAKAILNRHSANVISIAIPEAACDIDRPADLAGLSII